MNRGHRRTLGVAAGAILAVAVAITMAATMSDASGSKSGGACGSRAEVRTASSACGSGAVRTAGACGEVKTASGGCGSQVMAPASACASTCGSMKQANLVMPADVQVQSVEVEGGVDMVFTSADLAAVESFIRARLTQCAGSSGEKACGMKAEIVAGEESLTLSIRGEQPKGCCAESFMQQAEDVTEEAGEGTRST